MGFLPRADRLWRTLTVGVLAASVNFATMQPAITAEAASKAATPIELYFTGRALTARRELVRTLDDPEFNDPHKRLLTMGLLLDICINSFARDCILEYAPKYLKAEALAPEVNAIMRLEAARRVAYYLDFGRFAYGSPEVTKQILASELWRRENAYNGVLYLQRQVLALRVQQTLGDRDGAERSINKILSLIASLTNPQDDRLAIMRALTEVIFALTDNGQTERAVGV